MKSIFDLAEVTTTQGVVSLAEQILTEIHCWLEVVNRSNAVETSGKQLACFS
jgi:hypothetical protein